jgi:hypothetical protein
VSPDRLIHAVRRRAGAVVLLTLVATGILTASLPLLQIRYPAEKYEPADGDPAVLAALVGDLLLLPALLETFSGYD